MADQTYFAAVSRDEIGDQLHRRVDSYAKAKSVTATINERLALAYQYYYGLSPSGVHSTSQILRGGEQGELAEIRVNHSRSLVNTLLNLIIGPKLVWTPKATNRDYDSLRETALAASILEYYWGERQMSKYAVRALEEAIVFTEGFVLVEWDREAGEDVEAELSPLEEPAAPSLVSLDATNATLPLEPGASVVDVPMDLELGTGLDDALADATIHKSGDLRFTNVSAWDVIRDPNKLSYEELDYVIVRLRRNRYELAARYPEFSQEIINAPQDMQVAEAVKGRLDPIETDDIDCYYFFHKRTAALPTGRQTILLCDRTVIDDAPLEYDEIPLYRVTPAELIGTPYAYSPYLEILGIQELMDSLESSIATNQTTFGTQNVSMPIGTEIDDIAGGMRAFYTGPEGGKVEPLQLCKTAPEVFAHLETKKRDQELLMGLNAVVRGTLPGSPKEMSGAALALLQSQALQQSSVLQGNYIRLIERLGSAVIRILQKNATEPRKVDLVGKSNRYLVAEESFVGKRDLGRVKKVVVEIGNPLSQTAAGRAEIADKLITMGIMKTPEQYEQVLTTGRLDPLTHSTEDELMLILSENEDLARGITPPVLVHDDAVLHCKEHRSVLSSPNSRKDPKVLKAGMDHMHWHYSAYFGVPLVPQGTVSLDPMTGAAMPVDQYANVLADPMYRQRMLFLMGFPPTPMPLDAMAMGMMGPPPGAGPGGPPPHGPGPGGPPPGAKPPPPGLPGKAAGPEMPNGPARASLPKPPTNPATGEKWNPVDGGGAVNRNPN